MSIRAVRNLLPALVFCVQLAQVARAEDPVGEIAETPVVRNGERLYPDLDQALAEAEAGATLELLGAAPFANPFALTAKLTLKAAPGVEASVVAGPAAGLTIGAGGRLVVDGLRFEDYVGDALLKVNDASASLTVTNAVFRDIEGTNKWSGAVCVLKGTAEIADTDFENCRATGAYARNKTVLSRGGALHLGGSEATATLAGGRITGCAARTAGGGIYAQPGATLNVAGDLTVKGNAAGTAQQPDDIYLSNGAVLAVTGLADGLTRTIGVRYALERDGYGNATNDFFAVVGAGVSAAAAEAAAQAFFSDVLTETLQGAVAPDGRHLQWVGRELTDHQLSPDDPRAAVRVEKGGVAVGYEAIEQAFEWIDADATVTLLRTVPFSQDLTVAARVTLTAADPSAALMRSGDATIRVPATGALTLRGVTVRGSGFMSDAGLVYVNGGELTLDEGAVIEDIFCRSSSQRFAGGAVSVCNRGVVTLRSGATIRSCANAYANEGSKSGYGGGLTVNESTAYLLGGTVTGCSARRGAGVFAGSSSTVYVAGDLSVAGNVNLKGMADNLCVSDDSQLLLTGTGALTGVIGFNEGASADTNVFGSVAADFAGAAEDRQASAHRFTHDVTGDVGLAVANGATTLLVWSEAVDPDGAYVGADGRVYRIVPGDAYRIDPPEPEEGLVYDGREKTGVAAGVGYVLTGATATDAGDYVAAATPKRGFVWQDGSEDAVEIPWSIARGDYVLSGVTFEDAAFAYDGLPKTNLVVGTVPEWLAVTYAGNVRTDPGENEATATIAGESANWKPFSTVLTAKITVVGSKPGPDPEPVVTNWPTAIAFSEIARLDATHWRLVVTNRVPWCRYRLLATDDLMKDFAPATEWEQAVGEAASPAWTNELEQAEGAYFWRAEGTWGIVPKE